MRVLFWSGNFWPLIGGAEVLAIRLLPALRERGYEFMVVTSQRQIGLPHKTHYKEIPVYRFPLRGSCENIDQVMEIRQEITQLKRTFAPNLIHINALESGHFFQLITAKTHPAPLLVTLHDPLSSQAVSHDSWRRRLIVTADWVTCVSVSVMQETLRLVPEISSCSSVLYNGQEAPSSLPHPLPIDPPRLLCLGRLRKKKGFDIALSAFASIVDRFPEVHLAVAGDGPERAELQRQAVRLGIRKMVDFLGWVAPKDIPALVNAATVVVMPSRHEPFGLVALDAALMARPIVASRVGGLPEVVIHQETGLLVESEDVAGLADAVASLLDHPQTATRMGLAARQRAQEVFSWQQCVNGYDTLYRKLVLAPGTE